MRSAKNYPLRDIQIQTDFNEPHDTKRPRATSRRLILVPDNNLGKYCLDHNKTYREAMKPTNMVCVNSILPLMPKKEFLLARSRVKNYIKKNPALLNEKQRCSSFVWLRTIF